MSRRAPPTRTANWPTIQGSRSTTKVSCHKGRTAPASGGCAIRLLTIKELSARLGVNPNTVLKAYRALEYDDLIAAQPGVGTFVRVDLAGVTLAAYGPLHGELCRWLSAARIAGLDDERIEALFSAELRAARQAGAT